MSDDFRQWLTTELKRRNWSHRELARQSGISHVYTSKIIAGDRDVSANFCIAVAVALDVSPEYLLRLAGILPGEPEPITPGPVTADIMQLVENMPPEQRRFALEVLRLAESLSPEQRQQVLEYARFITQQRG